jgi:hypothetical protein
MKGTDRVCKEMYLNKRSVDQGGLMLFFVEFLIEEKGQFSGRGNYKSYANLK